MNDGPFYVITTRQWIADNAMHSAEEYVSYMQYNPYQSEQGWSHSHRTTDDKGSAFEFKTYAAAEVIACFVCGRVVDDAYKCVVYR